MQQEWNVKLSFGSWVYVAGLIGLSGGAMAGVLSAIWAALNGDWLAAIVSVVAAPLCGLLSFSVYAILGFVVYARIASSFPNSRLLSGEFSPGGEGDEHT